MNQKTTKELLKKIQADYNSIADDFSQTRQSGWKEFQLFLKYIKSNDKLADLGCGNGRLLSFIQKHRKIQYIGIDNSQNLLKEAKRQFPKAKFIEGNLLKLPLKNQSYDVATSIASFHHIPSEKLRNKALKEMHRIIKKNGILILTNWNLFQPKYKKYIWQARLRYIYSFGKYHSRDTFIPWSKTGIKRYYHAFTIKELRKLLKKNGFEIISEHIANNYTHICRKS